MRERYREIERFRIIELKETAKTKHFLVFP